MLPGQSKLVGEAYPFAAGGRLLLTVDNHNSVNGIREFARAKGATVDYAPLTVPDLRIDLPAHGRAPGAGRPDARQPASRSRAVEFFRREASACRSSTSRTDHRLGRLLDAAAFVPTNRLDLRRDTPDFRDDLVLQDVRLPHRRRLPADPQRGVGNASAPWFAGGTVNFATVQGRLHVLSPREAGFEDGTLNYLSIPAVEIGLAHISSASDMETIHTRVRCLTDWLFVSSSSCATATAAPWCASTVRRPRPCVAGR